MLKYESIEDLKKFLGRINSVLEKGTQPFSSRSEDCGKPLNKEEEDIIISLYNSYADEDKGESFQEIIGNFLQVFQILVPSQNFAKIFRYLVYLEWMEHRIQPNALNGKLYRDHILHLINVCWVGDDLIFKLDKLFYIHIKSSLQKTLPTECTEHLSEEEEWDFFIKFTWYITAMAHDLGYPIELTERKMSDNELFLVGKNYLSFDKLNKYFENRFPGKFPFFKNRLETIDKKLVDNPFLDCASVHPVIGCLELLHFLDRHLHLLKPEKKYYSYCYQLAALGIFQHHTRGEIDFELNPFGYILALADMIHEWKRYINIGIPRGQARPEFLPPISEVTIEACEKHDYLISYIIDESCRKSGVKGWDPERFEKDKQEELRRLKAHPGLPRFEYKLK